MAPIRVVLADDHALVRAGIRQYLERSDEIEVVGEADDGVAAQGVVERQIPDVLLADIKMPEMGGIQLTKWVRENHPQVKVLVISAYDDDPYVTAAVEAGASGYIMKNTAPNELIAAVIAVSEGKSSLDPAVAMKILKLASGDGASETLSTRELDVLALAAQGMSNKEIGKSLSISARTVQGHLRRVFEKLGVMSRTEAVTTALSRGIISLEAT